MEILNKDSNNRRNRRKTSIDLSTMVYGKIPPQARELEQAVLGACLLEKDAFQRIIDIVASESFYVDAHQKIFSAMHSLYEKMQPIDILTVVEELKTESALDAVGGPYYLTQLDEIVMSSANIEAHAKIIQQKYIKREVIRISGELIGYAYEDSNEDTELMMDAASEAFYSLQASVFGNKMKSFEYMMSMELEEIDNIKKQQGITGIPSGYHSIDQTTAGWQPADLIILASRPSMGKTALAAKMAYRSAAVYHVPTLFFSLEMDAGKINKRIISSETEISMSKSLHNWYDEHEKSRIRSFADEKGKIPFWIDDNSSHSLASLSAIARKEKKKKDIGLIFIDYLQLINLSSDETRKQGNRDQDIGIITRGLKRLAKELGIPVIVLCQLSRAAEEKEKARPQLRHLRESGNIENDADVVAFLYREYYYLQRTTPGQLFDPSITKHAEFIFAKHRNGPLDTIDLIYDEKYVSFKDQDDMFVPFHQTVDTTAKLFIQKGSRMSDDTDNTEDTGQPF